MWKKRKCRVLVPVLVPVQCRVPMPVPVRCRVPVPVLVPVLRCLVPVLCLIRPIDSLRIDSLRIVPADLAG
jgi:hypothetical protein